MSLSKVWLQHFREWAPHPLPLNYLALDTETIGEGLDQVITEVGYVVVKDGYVADQGTWVLNWLDKDYEEWVPEDWVHSACQQMQRVMGKPLNVTPERMLKEGQPPREVLRQTKKLLEDVSRRKLPIVGNNVEHFDIRVLNSHFHEWLNGQAFDKSLALIIDAGLLFKALQISPPVLPRYSDTLPKYLQRMRGTHRDQKYGLGFCLTTLQVDVDERQLHGAEYDAYCSHRLFERLRKDLQ